MKKIIILTLGLSLVAASCDLAGGTFDLSNPVKGVFRSQDGGESFRSAVKLDPKGDISGVSVNSLAFDSRNPDTIYLASPSGLYKSTDSAETWKFILSGLQAADIAVDPSNTDTIYAAGISGVNGKVIKSLDGGSSWVDIYTEPSKNNAVVTVAVNPFDSSVVLAGLFSGEIIRSTDSGHTWQAVTDLADRMMRMRFASINSAYVLTLNKGLKKSSDNGLTWTDATAKLTTEQFTNSVQGQSTASAFYDFSLDLRQPGVLYLGTQEGLFRTVNDGVDWAFVKLPLKGSALRTSSVAVDPTNSNAIYTVVASTVLKSVNGGLTWQTKVLPMSSEVRAIIINPRNNNLIFMGVGNTR